MARRLTDEELMLKILPEMAQQGRQGHSMSALKDKLNGQGYAVAYPRLRRLWIQCGGRMNPYNTFR